MPSIVLWTVGTLAFLGLLASPAGAVASSTPGSNSPGLHITGTAAEAFIAVVAFVLLIFWFVPILMTARSALKFKREKLAVVNTYLEARKASLTEGDVAGLLSSVEASGDDGTGSNTGSIQNLTGALVALTTLTLVGFALTMVMLSSATDSPDLRKTIVTALVSILASIAGFYFGARTAQQSSQQTAAQTQGPTASPPAFLTAQPPLDARANELYAYNFSASGTPPPTYSLANSPEWLAIDGGTGILSGTPSEAQPFTYTVVATSPAGSASAGPFTVQVTPAE